MAPTIPVEFGGQRESKKWLRIGVSPMMGKSRKVSKGYSHGFVPDYRHAVETMAESEGFGSSGRVDTEMTASEDSCAPKRKCISLNGDSCASFGVPIQFFSLSKMSLPERKDLELRLKSDLEKVRDFQRKIALVSSSFAALPPSIDIHSFSAGQTRPEPDTSRPIAAPHPPGKKRAPPGRGGGGRAKKGAASRPDPLKQALPPSAANALIMKQCETLLNRLMGHSYAWVFNAPVDVVKLKIPDYYTVIKHPMDLGTVKTNLTSGKYTSPGAFAADVRLTFSNAMTYNPRGNDVHVMANTLSKFFEMRWKAIEKKLSAITEPVAPVNPSTLLEAEIAAPLPPSKKKKTESLGSEIKQEPIKKVMSDDEKHKLGLELEDLLAELPESIIDFLKESSYNGSQVTDDEIEIDIDTLSDETLIKLRMLLDDFLADKQKNLAKAETCEMELHNESGFSNSSVQPCKGNDPIDEDVDIGGNDLPISSFPPVEIEKDPAVRSSKCSSSSSESGSSSSDSDSGSSSGSEADGAEAPVIVNSAKETSGPEVKIEENKDVPDNPDTEYYSANGLSQVEQKSQSNTVSVEMDDRQEGESAPSERQVSPTKRYRAALLKNRFADTILKAQEKAIEKGDKQDPEKLRLEKDELEKRKREEKARLQAEAKAAEEARMNAEAEAAAEAKRRIELEREAARQALQKMEKTVDINENCRFMQDLEMLGVAPTEPLHSFVDKTSPDHSLDRLGSFNFQGISNPLEQLGLYMKKDDDEEEESEPHSAPATTDDPEEGEID